jgi:hypothetical protein
LSPKPGNNFFRGLLVCSFDLTLNAPLKYVKKATIPVLFAHAEGDNFIKKKHSEALFEEIGSPDKSMIFFDGDHNSGRPSFFFDQVAAFFERTLLAEHLEQEKKEKKNESTDELSIEEILKENSKKSLRKKTLVNKNEEKILELLISPRGENIHLPQSLYKKTITKEDQDDFRLNMVKSLKE